MAAPSWLRRPIHVPIRLPFLWLAPLLLALWGHVYALPKAYMPLTGPGLHIALVNDRTIRAQKLCVMLSQHWWIFVLYGILLVAAFGILRMKRVHVAVRAVVLLVMATPGLWYFVQASYLGGKLLPSL